MKKVTQKEELSIYRNLLIKLHTAIWTGNNDSVKRILKAIGEYSYARTNSNFGMEKEEEQKCIRTLLKLKDII
jgi:hypothetical protein